MIMKIGDRSQADMKIILPPSKTIHLQALNMCMAPGGYSANILKYNPYDNVCGLSLPIDEGGHDILLPDWQTDKRIEIHFIDITMLAAEIGFPDLASRFSNNVPFTTQTFDAVFCDGQVLHTHIRAEWTKNEAARLSTAQLVIASRRIKRGGTLVILLHQAYSLHTVRASWVI
ncbi:hypothetical protein N7522_003521 [Penicillium canescens]|nr:hypothetical protein N7522_003521 [Penicillium canescens]KAJ6060183.1 hypothetical protein N7444_002037 [Penicillium canescens]